MNRVDGDKTVYSRASYGSSPPPTSPLHFLVPLPHAVCDFQRVDVYSGGATLSMVVIAKFALETVVGHPRRVYDQTVEQLQLFLSL